MKISIEGLQNWLGRKKSEQHEAIKLRIQNLQDKRSYNIILKKPQYIIDKIDKDLKRLNKKLLKGRL